MLKSAAPDAVRRALAALDAAAAERRAIDKLLAARIDDAGALPDLAPLAAMIARMRAIMAPHAATTAPKLEPEEAALAMTDGSGAAPATVVAPAGRLPARLDSREDVLRALELVVDYYRRREPGSAVPLLVERARRMVPMTFMEAIGDLAPDAVSAGAGFARAADVINITYSTGAS